MMTETEHTDVTFEDEFDGDVFGRAMTLDAAIGEVLAAFEEWGSEGYYDPDELDTLGERRTAALDGLREAQSAFLSITAVCSCGWRSTKHEDEAAAEMEWFEHVEPETQGG